MSEYQELSCLSGISGGLMWGVGQMERAPAALCWCLEAGLHVLAHLRAAQMLEPSSLSAALALGVPA